jgi:hypothetical protein
MNVPPFHSEPVSKLFPKISTTVLLHPFVTGMNEDGSQTWETSDTQWKGAYPVISSFFIYGQTYEPYVEVFDSDADTSHYGVRRSGVYIPFPSRLGGFTHS